MVRTLPDSSHCFLIKHGKDSVVARLDLSSEQELLTILSGRESTVRLFDSLIGQDGTPPDNWMSLILRAGGLTWSMSRRHDRQRISGADALTP